MALVAILFSQSSKKYTSAEAYEHSMESTRKGLSLRGEGNADSKKPNMQSASLEGSFNLDVSKGILDDLYLVSPWDQCIDDTKTEDGMINSILSLGVEGVVGTEDNKANTELSLDLSSQEEKHWTLDAKILEESNQDNSQIYLKLSDHETKCSQAILDIDSLGIFEKLEGDWWIFDVNEFDNDNQGIDNFWPTSAALEGVDIEKDMIKVIGSNLEEFVFTTDADKSAIKRGD